MTLKEKIKAADDLKKLEVHVPEWDVTVYIRPLTGAERDSWETETYQMQANDEGKQEVNINKENIRARLLVRSLVDENGERIFTEAEASDLGKKSAKVIERLYKKVQEMNAVDNQDVENLAKNS